LERVTLSRELSLDEMRTIAQEGVELEAFGHGALCFCYSGVCMMSSLAGGRSANRGLCAQPCRLPYDLVDEDGHVNLGPWPGCDPSAQGLSARLTTWSPAADAGVASLKVEGRMKAPDYVYSVISAYRGALDDLARRKPSATTTWRHATDAPPRLQPRLYQQPTWTIAPDDEMMSYERSNNRGELVGEVVARPDDLEDTLVRGAAPTAGASASASKTVAEVDVRLDQPRGGGRPARDPSHGRPVAVPHHAPSATPVAGATITCRDFSPHEAGCPVRVIRSKARHGRGRARLGPATCAPTRP
jgi:putative protease